MRQGLSGELELGSNPQGAATKRMRAGGVGIPTLAANDVGHNDMTGR